MSTGSTRAEGYDPAVEASPFDKVAYLFALVGLYVATGALFFYGFWHKAVDADFEILRHSRSSSTRRSSGRSRARRPPG